MYRPAVVPLSPADEASAQAPKRARVTTSAAISGAFSIRQMWIVTLVPVTRARLLQEGAFAGV